MTARTGPCDEAPAPLSWGTAWWNRDVQGNDDGPPPLHFGDYPDGAYWSAERIPGLTEDDALDLSVEGDVIRFMWDYGVVVPLWDGNGLVPEEQEWLRGALGLSDGLIHDLREWGNDMNHLDANAPSRAESAYRRLDQRARALVDRLAEELGPRLEVRYHPW